MDIIAALTASLNLPASLPEQTHELITIAYRRMAMSQHAAIMASDPAMNSQRQEIIARRHAATAREAVVGAAGILIGLGKVASLADGVDMIEHITGIYTPRP